MTNSKRLVHHLARIFLGTVLLVIARAAWSQTTPDFSGKWKQDNDSCQPKRNTNATIQIAQDSSQLTVETSISRGTANSRHAVQKYTTDGAVSISTGADGDEFHTTVVWKNASLVFSIEEHEDGRILRSQETWSLIDNGATLQRTREQPDGERQTLVYRRQTNGPQAR